MATAPTSLALTFYNLFSALLNITLPTCLCIYILLTQCSVCVTTTQKGSFAVSHFVETMVGVFSLVTGRAGPSGFGSSSTAEQVTEGIHAANLTAIITGQFQHTHTYIYIYILESFCICLCYSFLAQQSDFLRAYIRNNLEYSSYYITPSSGKLLISLCRSFYLKCREKLELVGLTL